VLGVLGDLGFVVASGLQKAWKRRVRGGACYRYIADFTGYLAESFDATHLPRLAGKFFSSPPMM